MANKRIVLTMEGPGKNDDHLELSVFAEKIKHFFNFLNNCVKNGGKDEIVFRVVSLSHSSPATIACEPTSKDALASTAAFDSVRNHLSFVEREEQGARLRHTALSAMEQLAKFNPEKIVSAEIQTIGDETENGEVYRLDKRFRENLIRARSTEEKVVNTIRGRLKQINVHNGANTFRIYTSLSDAPFVNCNFPQSLLEEVQVSLGFFISVFGECFYRPDAMFPYKMNVREMKVLPPSETLPSLKDLCGIAPDGTGDKSPEQFVRELRDTWDKNA